MDLTLSDDRRQTVALTVGLGAPGRVTSDVVYGEIRLEV
jgi:hypothetical protein